MEEEPPKPKTELKMKDFTNFTKLKVDNLV